MLFRLKKLLGWVFSRGDAQTHEDTNQGPQGRTAVVANHDRQPLNEGRYVLLLHKKIAHNEIADPDRAHVRRKSGRELASLSLRELKPFDEFRLPLKEGALSTHASAESAADWERLNIIGDAGFVSRERHRWDSILAAVHPFTRGFLQRSDKVLGVGNADLGKIDRSLAASTRDLNPRSLEMIFDMPRSGWIEDR